MPTYPNTACECEVGDYVSYTVGPRENHDYGRVCSVYRSHDGESWTVEVAWAGSEQRTSQDLASTDWDVWTTLDAAEDAYSEAAER